MKYFKQKSLSNKHQHLASCLCNASFHVEHAVKEQLVIEGTEAEAEEVYQEQPQESEVAEEDQELGTDFTDCYNTQGKHRCMKKKKTQFCLQLSLTILLYYCI